MLCVAGNLGGLHVEGLTIYETENPLYEFNGGWLYNSLVDVAERKQVDRELTALRINGTVRVTVLCVHWFYVFLEFGGLLT